MKKKLYYVVEKETTNVGNVEETTGVKLITIYDIVKNKPKQFAEIEGKNSDSTRHLIVTYLIDNGYVDNGNNVKNYEFIQL